MKAKFALLALSLFGLLMITSCNKDADRDKFLGTYNVNENCTSGNWNYSIGITASSANDSDVILSNFGNFGVNVRATVSGDNISINDTQNAIQFSGSGNIAGNTLSIIYSASQLGFQDNCTATCIRQ
jgi:Tfp pilus assembly protein FimT